MTIRLEGLDVCRRDGQISYTWSDERDNPLVVPNRLIMPGDIVRVNRGENERIDITVRIITGSVISGEITSIATPFPARVTLDGVQRGASVMIDETEVFSVTRPASTVRKPC
jgi:hypothetical protein